jgi:hypothetical protein
MTGSLFLGWSKWLCVILGAGTVGNANDSKPTGPIGPEALSRLMDRHAATLELLARQWCDAAPDVVQEVLGHEAYYRLRKSNSTSMASPGRSVTVCRASFCPSSRT